MNAAVIVSGDDLRFFNKTIILSVMGITYWASNWRFWAVGSIIVLVQNLSSVPNLHIQPHFIAKRLLWYSPSFSFGDPLSSP